jgi:membrane protein implicated in regulation of membrane protease activity
MSFDSPVLAWVVVAVASALIEVSIPHFGVIFASLGAVAAALVAGLGLGLPFQLVTFVVVLGLSLVVLRPRLMGKVSPGVPSRTDTLIDHEGIVTEAIEPTIGAGRVNVGGQDWAARARTPVPTGTRVRVVGADGIVLEVSPT